MDLKTQLDEIRKQRIKIYHILSFDLSIARVNELVTITGSYIYCLLQSGTASLVLNELEGDSIDLLKFRAIKAPFYRLFLSNAAQVGITIKLAIGVQSDWFEIDDSGASILGGVITEASSPSLFNIPCPVANTEYVQGLGECRKFMVKARGGILKVALVFGQSGTYYILLADGQSWNEDLIHPTALNLYFQSATAGMVAEIVKWL